MSGIEIAIYQDTTLDQWNVWGLDNVGKIESGNARYFYLKDHLGSIRAIVNTSNNIVSAQDYDMWGSILDGRSYTSDASRYKFTNKQRDNESSYDYFGARYYDSRIGRWGQVELLMDKYLSWSPYNYGLCKPINLLDANGLDLVLGGDVQKAYTDLQSILTTEMQDRLTVDENNVVHFDALGLDLINDAASELINNMVTSESKYLFEVANTTIGIQRESSPKYQAGEIVYFDLSKEPGIVNLSITPRNIDGGVGLSGQLPKGDYSGQVTLGTGNWTIPRVKGTDVLNPRSDVVYHELAENYIRTEKKQPYARPDLSGAHKDAASSAAKYKKQVGKYPGEVGRYVP